MDKTKQIVTTTVIRIGKSILNNEHSFFLLNSIDDTEHIPKIRRIVESVESELKQLGLNTLEAKNLSEELREYGKSLFMESWMGNVYEFEDQNEVRIEGSDEFNSIYSAYG